MTRLRVPDTPWAAVLITAGAYSALLVGMLARHGWDPSWFVRAGDWYCDPTQTPTGLYVAEEGGGYDGQFFYGLALDPLGARPTRFGITLDNPPYRQQRILYPVLAWLASLGGRPALVPAALLGVNLAALCALAYVGGAYARSLGRAGAWGAPLSLYPGLAFGLLLCLAEPVAVALCVGGLLLLRHDRPLSAAVALTLAVLAKETTLLVPVAVLLASPRTGGCRRAVVSGVPLAVWAAWQLALLSRWGQLPLLAGAGNVGVPLAGLIEFLGAIFPPSGRFHVRWLVEIAAVAVIGVAVTWVLLRRRATVERRVCVAWVLYLILACSLTSLVWSNDWAFLRALSEFYVLGVLILLSAIRSRPARAVEAA
jgi:hypothetical protein